LGATPTFDPAELAYYEQYTAIVRL